LSVLSTFRTPRARPSFFAAPKQEIRQHRYRVKRQLARQTCVQVVFEAKNNPQICEFGSIFIQYEGNINKKHKVFNNGREREREREN